MKEDLEQKLENAAILWKNDPMNPQSLGLAYIDDFVAGAKSEAAKEYWQQGMYSEEEVLKLIRQAFQGARTKRRAELKVGYDYVTGLKRKYLYPDAKEWFEQNKKERS